MHPRVSFSPVVQTLWSSIFPALIPIVLKRTTFMPSFPVAERPTADKPVRVNHVTRDSLMRHLVRAGMHLRPGQRITCFLIAIPRESPLCATGVRLRVRSWIYTGARSECSFAFLVLLFLSCTSSPSPAPPPFVAWHKGGWPPFPDGRKTARTIRLDARGRAGFRFSPRTPRTARRPRECSLLFISQSEMQRIMHITWPCSE